MEGDQIAGTHRIEMDGVLVTETLQVEMDGDLIGGTRRDEMEGDLVGKTRRDEIEGDLVGETRRDEIEGDLIGETRRDEMDGDLVGETCPDEMEGDLIGETRRDEMDGDLVGETRRAKRIKKKIWRVHWYSLKCSICITAKRIEKETCNVDAHPNIPSTAKLRRSKKLLQACIIDWRRALHLNEQTKFSNVEPYNLQTLYYTSPVLSPGFWFMIGPFFTRAWNKLFS